MKKQKFFHWLGKINFAKNKISLFGHIPTDNLPLETYMPVHTRNIEHRIYVLTRTSGRPHFFHQNHSSIQEQSYPHIYHYVSCDDTQTEKYVQSYPSSDHFRYFPVTRIPKEGNGHFPYNLYLNHLLAQIPKDSPETRSWVMFLDDDDVFTSKESVQILVDQLKQLPEKKLGTSILLWPVQFPGRLVPKKPFRTPTVGNFSMIGILFPIHFRDQVAFKDRKGGDYLFLKDLWPLVTPHWLKDQVLTKINYEQPRRIGSGQRNDLHLNTVQKKKYKLSLSEYTQTHQMSDPKPEIKIVPKVKSPITSTQPVPTSTQPVPTSTSTQSAPALSAREKARARIKEVIRSHPTVDLDQYGSHSTDDDSNSSVSPDPPQKISLSSPIKIVQDTRATTAPTTHTASATHTALVTHTPHINPEELKTLIQTTIRESLEDLLPKFFNSSLTSPLEKNATLSKNLPSISPVLNSTRPKVNSSPEQQLSLLLRSQSANQSKSGHQLTDLLVDYAGREMSVSDEDSVSETDHRNSISESKTFSGRKGRDSLSVSSVSVGDESIDGASVGGESVGNESVGGESVDGGESSASIDGESVSESCIELNDYLDMIFILNIHGQAEALQADLESLGLTNMQPVAAQGRQKSFFDLLWDLARVCRKRKYRQVMILQDDLHLHVNFVAEFLTHLSTLQEASWKLVVVSAPSNLAPHAELDWEFYLETYPDLTKITTESRALQHWKAYGVKEKRYPCRGLLSPDLLTGVSGVLLNESIYEDLARLRNSRNVAQYLLKNHRSEVLTMSPLLGLNRMNRLTLRRNQHNLKLYRVEQ